MHILHSTHFQSLISTLFAKTYDNGVGFIKNRYKHCFCNFLESIDNGWCCVYTYSDTDKYTKAEWTKVSQKHVLVRHIGILDYEILSQQTRCSCDGPNDMMYSALHT